jgi:WD40 repeat protein
VPGHEVLGEIARGGMGVVYRAREHETRRTVALKMLRPRLADEQGMRERFRMEAAAVAALDHPSILPVYRVGQIDDIPFFTMKLAAEGTLADRRESLRGNWRGIAALMVTLAGAVQHAHQHGVLHRDLKPGNVLFDDEGRAWLSDFGLVKLIEGGSSLTRTQEFLGTAHYCAPEVAAANAGAATVASDVWSLGAMLYELLTGRLPFDAPGLVPLLRKIAEEAPAPFTAADAVPADLRVIALKCLHKEPAQRYESAAALAADLQAWLEGRPIKARAASLVELAVAWGRRNPVLAGLGAALAVSLMLSGALLWRGYLASRQDAEEARAGETAARAAEAAALIEETQARMGNGQWVDRGKAVAAVRRAQQLQPSPVARDVLVSLLALPELERVGAVPYDGRRPVYFNGDLSRYAARQGAATTVRDSSDHRVLFTIPAAGLGTFPVGPLSADGSRLSLRTASGTDVWDVASATRLGSLRSAMWLPGFSDDGRITAGEREILDLGPQPPVVRPFAATTCQALAIAPDGSRILLAQGDRLRLQLVDSANGGILREHELPGTNTMHCAEWTADGTRFFTGSTDGRVMRWDAEAFAPDWILPLHTAGVDDLALFDGDRHLITQGRDCLTRIWNLQSESCVATLPWGGVRVQASRDGHRLAIDCPPEGKSLIYRFHEPLLCRIVRLPAANVPNSYYQGRAAVIPAADGQSFALTAGHDVHLLDRDGALTGTLACGQCDHLVAAPGGGGWVRDRRMAGKHELLRVPFDWAGGWQDPALRLATVESPVAFAADQAGGRLLVALRNRVFSIDPATGRQTPFGAPALPRGTAVTAAAVSHCGRFFAWAGSLGETRQLHVTEVATGRETATLTLTEAPRVIAFTADGEALLTGDNHRVSCHDLGTGRVFWSVPHTRRQEPELKTPITIAVAAGNGAIAVPLDAGSVSLIDRRDGRVRLTLRHPFRHDLRAIGLSPDGGRLLAVGSYVVQVWKLDAAAVELRRHGMEF